jgi:hypothetical protein
VNYVKLFLKFFKKEGEEIDLVNLAFSFIVKILLCFEGVSSL